MDKRKRIGEILLDAKLISETQLAAALHSQRTWGGKLGSTLVRMGFAKEEEILKCLSVQLKLPNVNFGKMKISPRALSCVPIKMAEKYNVIPVALKEEGGKKTIVLAMSDPTNLDVISEIEFQAGVNIRPVVATESSIAKEIDKAYRHRRLKEEYGFEKHINLSAASDADEMIIVSRGEEVRVPGVSEPADAMPMLKALIKVLGKKGIITLEELEKALKQR